MTKKFLIFTILAGIAGVVSAQDDSNKQPPNFLMYSVFINIIPDGMNIPAIGLINYGAGSHSTAQIGLVNHVQKSLNGAQAGLVNSTGRNLNGAQVGLLNSVGGSTDGAQIGLISITKDTMRKGAQMGLVNIVGGTTSKNTQMGLANIAKAARKSMQMGIANIVGGTESDAMQIGLANVVAQTTMQIGLANATKRLRGVQIGLVNYVDSVESGVPIGLLSIVRRGDYYALEVSTNEMAAAMVSFKIGIEKFYTTINVGYSPRATFPVTLGAGFGSVIPIGKGFFFNPELASELIFNDVVYKDRDIPPGEMPPAYRNTDHDDDFYPRNYLHLTAAFGYSVGRFSIVAGPVLAWQHKGHDVTRHVRTFYSFYQKDINADNRILLGAKVGVRMRLN